MHTTSSGQVKFYLLLQITNAFIITGNQKGTMYWTVVKVYPDNPDEIYNIYI